MHIFDFAVASIFLLSLIAVSRLRQYLTADDKESYRNVVAGLALLATVSLANVYSGLGLLAKIPFLSEPLFFRLLFWIGMITGLTFLISGVTSWVPLSRSYRQYNKERIEKLELLKRVEQLLRVESRLPVVLRKTLDYVVQSYDLAEGAVYLYSSRKGQPVWLGAIDESGVENRQLRDISWNTDAWHESPDSRDSGLDRFISNLPANTKIPDHFVPVSVGDDLAGFFLLWTKPSLGIKDEDRTNLRIAGDIIGHEVWRGLLQTVQNFKTDLEDWYGRLQKQIDYRSNTRSNIVTLVKCLREKVKVNLFSLTLMEDDYTGQRYSIGETGGLLTETGLDLGKAPSATAFVYGHAEPMFMTDPGSETTLPIDEIIVRNGYGSLALLPVRHGSKVEGVMAVGSSQQGGFSQRQRAYIEAILPVVGNVAAAEKYHLEMRTRERRGYVLNTFLSQISESGLAGDIFARAAAIITGELKPSAVRISTIETKSSFLKSRVLETTRPSSQIIPAQGSLILSIMPYHQLVLDTGRPMMINQESTDRRMAEAESRQVFGIDLSSALLVPVNVGSTPVAIISIAETRAWDRYQFRQSDIQFVTAVAAALSVAIQLGRKLEQADSSRSAEPRIEAYAKARARGGIRSSLSGILGSVELLKASENPTPENLNKCLAIIDKSARRISEFVAAGN